MLVVIIIKKYINRIDLYHLMYFELELILFTYISIHE